MVEVDLRRHTAEMVVSDLRPDGAVELVARLAEQDERLAGFGTEVGREATMHVVDHAEHTDDRRGQDRRRPRLVVETDVAARDRNPELTAPVGQPVHGLLELPHHRRVLRRTEVEAVRHRAGGCTRRRHVAIGLGQRELRTPVRIEERVAPRSVGGQSDSATGLFVDPDHSGVGMLCEHGIAAHVPVVLIGDELAAAERGRLEHVEQGLTQLVGSRRTLQGLRGRLDHTVLPVGAGDRTLVDRTLVRDGPRRDVDDGLTVPRDHQVVAVGDLADHGGEHVPLAAHGEEGVDILRRDDRAHAFLRLAGEHLRGRHPHRAHRNLLELDLHAAVAGRCQFRCGTRKSGTAEILDADDKPSVIELETALDEHLLGERIAHLNARQLLAIGAGLAGVVKGLRGEHRHTADAVESGASTEQDDLVPGARREGQLQVLGAQRTRTQGVDQGVAGIAGVEDRFATDVGQPERVAVAADTADHAVEHTARVGGVGLTEAELVHHRDRAGTHGHDVADDAADTGRCALIRLDVAGMVVRLDLERDGPAVADVDDARVLADPREHARPHFLGGGLTEVAQMHLRRLVAAVLRPHHRVHGEFGIGGSAPEDLLDPLVLVVLESELLVGLGLIGALDCPFD